MVVGGGANLRQVQGEFLEARLMAGVLKVEGGIVQVEAGCTLRRLRQALLARKLTLASWPYYLDSTVGARSRQGRTDPLSSMVPWRTLLWRAASLLLLKMSGTMVSPSTSLL